MGLFDFLRKKEVVQNTSDKFVFKTLTEKPMLNLSKPNDQLTAFLTIPQLFSIITNSAKIFADNVYYESDAEGNQTNKEISLLKNPHPLYSESEFFEAWYKQKELFGGAFVYKTGAVGMPNGLFLLPAQNLRIKTKELKSPNSIFDAKKITDIIEKYQFLYNGKYYDIDPSDVWATVERSIAFNDEGYLRPESKTKACKMPINNLYNSYKARHTLITKRGALGAWVSNQTDDYGQSTLKSEQITDVQNQFNDFYNLQDGFTQIITSANIKWEQAAMAVKDLMIYEGMESDKIALCDVYQYPILLLNEMSGSTYSNMGIADKNLYTKKIIPDWNMFANSFNSEFGTNIKFDTSWIKSIQEDENEKAKANNLISTSILKIMESANNGYIDDSQARELIKNLYGYEF